VEAQPPLHTNYPDGSHAARAELAHEAIAVGERRRQPFKVGHVPGHRTVPAVTARRECLFTNTP
jgi:hypothetical protein